MVSRRQRCNMPGTPPFNIESIKDIYPFESNWWKHNGLRYHYLDEGKGDVLLMLHGNPTWSFYYRELITAFSDRYRVIVPDLMGMGLSDRPTIEQYDHRYRTRIEDVEAFMDHLGLKENVTLVAHDWGGIIGSGVAGRNPEKFSRYIFMNTAGFRMPEGKRLPLRLSYARNFPILPKLQIQGMNAFAYLATHMGVEKKMSPDARRGLLAPYGNWRNRFAIYRFIQDIALYPEDPSYQTIKETDEHLHKLRERPMLILWGKGDFIFDMDILDIWRQRFPDATIGIVEDAGHYIVEDVPEVVIEQVGKFLSDNPLEGGKN